MNSNTALFWIEIVITIALMLGAFYAWHFNAKHHRPHIDDERAAVLVLSAACFAVAAFRNDVTVNLTLACCGVAFLAFAAWAIEIVELSKNTPAFLGVTGGVLVALFASLGASHLIDEWIAVVSSGLLALLCVPYLANVGVELVGKFHAMRFAKASAEITSPEVTQSLAEADTISGTPASAAPAAAVAPPPETISVIVRADPIPPAPAAEVAPAATPSPAPA
ncbi:MAG TPA: hypothetical protein VFT82_01010 [Candidatus Paceibacterota bacterium]|nr:hypothetical protein [Candidatus Paceibacterota bacterium]